MTNPLKTSAGGGIRDDILVYQQAASKSLTMPHSDPSLPPRPEFPPFTVLNLCGSIPIDGGEFSAFPEHHGWVVHHKDIQCHALCPPTGICFEGMERGAREGHYKSHGPISPMLSSTDGAAVTHASKATFLQA